MQQVIERTAQLIEKRGSGTKKPMNEGPMRKRIRVLVVDDEDTLRRTTALLVKTSGHTPIEARNGLDAIKVLEKEKVDMIITDFNMPLMDGEELIIRIKKMDPSIPIAVVTATEDRDVIPRLLSIGACTVIKKPFSFEDIKEVIERNI
ncbi:response regulator [Candidatus Micrarchaeota archaeon]|nr:response regulator [Candidatus Micrarchaeota archaeon]